MTKEKMRKRVIVTSSILCSIALLIFVLPYFINVCTNHRLHYLIEQIKGKLTLTQTHYQNLGLTPDRKYSLHVLVDSWLGTEYRFEATTPFSTKYKKVLSFSEEHFKAPDGPLLKAQTPILCSKDSRYIALIASGWYVDCYDFQSDINISPYPLAFMGDFGIKEHESQFQELKNYHAKISNIIGQDAVPLINDSKSQK